jgi:lysophospholipase L1-like esterase
MKGKSMNLNNVDLIGIEYPMDDPDFPEAVRLQRCPEKLRPKLNEGAQQQILRPASGEIRFVTDDNRARITVSGVNEPIKATIFFGEFQLEIQNIPAHPTTIDIEMPQGLAELDPKYPKKMPFNPKVIRLQFWGGQVRLHNIEGSKIRPPQPEELPAKRLLTYGTSITHGAAASAPHLSYATQLARRLKMDLINLGLSGSCHCEYEMADYIASRNDWDVATLALSVNMSNGNFTLNEFADRVNYMVDRVAGSNTNRPVFAITLYPYFGDFGIYPGGKEKLHGMPEDFRQELRDAVDNAGHKNLHLIEGPDILSDIGGLTPDLIHPADNGMIQMGENLAKKIRGFL